MNMILIFMTLPYENIVHMFCHVPEHQKIYITVTVENGVKHQLQHKKSGVSYMCQKKCMLCKETNDGGGHQMEGGVGGGRGETTRSDGNLLQYW